MSRAFVLISGLPGSGKSTLARQLAPALNLPLIDKDDILERLFESKGTGDAAWRRMLSRESDAILQAEATAAPTGAILVSFWHQDGMLPDSANSDAVAFKTFKPRRAGPLFMQSRNRGPAFLSTAASPGHLDGAKSYAEIFAGTQTLACLELLGIGPRVTVDTSQALRLDDVIATSKGF